MADAPEPPYPRTRTIRRMRPWALHAMRWLLLLAICWQVRLEHLDWQRNKVAQRDTSRLLSDVRRFQPAARRLRPVGNRQDEWQVLGTNGEVLGRCLTTSPSTDSIVGFSGPTNVLLVFDESDVLIGAGILSSQDTQEHVAKVVGDSAFLSQLVGRSRDRLANSGDVAGVSGATLTSLAILEAVGRRAGGDVASLRFPKQLTISDAKRFFPAAQVLRKSVTTPGAINVLDGSNQQLGSLLRTSPIADAVVGYQGPTDAVFAFDSAGHLIDYHVRRSFDNQPYVRYVEEDRHFRKVLRGRRLAEFAQLSEQDSIEGVSGATMTSQAMVEALHRLAVADQRAASKPAQSVAWRWSAQDWGTLSVMIAASLFAFTRLRRSRPARFVLQIGLVVYFGFLNGDMLSQALLGGWVQNGIPWQRAPALALLAATAFLLPATGRGPWYCHSVCPFGAAQGLVRNRLRIRLRPGGLILASLKAIPGLCLVLVLLALLHRASLPLAAIEPFHAFLWPLAGWATVMVAAVGLAASLVMPMAYCRFGCPTGALLDFGRYHRHADRFRRRDAVAIGLLVMAVGAKAGLLLPAGSAPITPHVKRIAQVNDPRTHTAIELDPTMRHLTGNCMGTTWDVVIGSRPTQSLTAIRQAISYRLEALENDFSHWRSDSTISAFNRSARGIQISNEFATVVRTALRIGAASDGALDVTAAPLIRAWGFGPHQHPRVPSAGEIAAARSATGMGQLRLQRVGNTFLLSKSRPAVELDLSSLAKGYAVDSIVELLRGMGIRDALVGIGGEYRAVGTKHGQAWHVGIEWPSPVLASTGDTVVQLADLAIATSGNYRRFVDAPSGLRYSHIVDPRTGIAIHSGVLEVSVIARTTMEADAWATALMVHAPDHAISIAKREHLAVRIVWNEGGALRTESTAAFRDVTCAASVP